LLVQNSDGFNNCACLCAQLFMEFVSYFNNVVHVFYCFAEFIFAKLRCLWKKWKFSYKNMSLYSISWS